MTFQVLDLKEKYFLDLLNSNDNIIELSYIKSGSWLKFFGYFNSLYARVSRAITNHAPIGEYRLRFFPREEFRCLCRLYPIETRCHILYECRRFNKYWNPRRDLSSHFVMFLEFNPSVFTFPGSTSSSVLSRTHNQFFFFFSFPLLLFSFSFSLFCFFSLYLHVVIFVLYITTKQLPWSAYVLHVIIADLKKKDQNNVTCDCHKLS